VADQDRELQNAVSTVIRFFVSLLLPAWGVIMVLLGIYWRSGWWIGTGAATLFIGVIQFSGSSSADAISRRITT
jgi:hypothetical protein